MCMHIAINHTKSTFLTLTRATNQPQEAMGEVWYNFFHFEDVPNLAYRRIAEALHIYQAPNTTNLDCGLTLDSVWFPLLT